MGLLKAGGFAAPVAGVATGAVRKESPARDGGDATDCGIPPPTGLAEREMPPEIEPVEVPPENEPLDGDDETGLETCEDDPALEWELALRRNR